MQVHQGSVALRMQDVRVQGDPAKAPHDCYQTVSPFCRSNFYTTIRKVKISKLFENERYLPKYKEKQKISNRFK